MKNLRRSNFEMIKYVAKNLLSSRLVFFFLFSSFLHKKFFEFFFEFARRPFFINHKKKVLNALLCNDINFRKCKSIWNVRISSFLIQIILHTLQKEYSILKGPPVVRTLEKMWYVLIKIYVNPAWNVIPWNGLKLLLSANFQWIWIHKSITIYRPG